MGLPVLEGRHLLLVVLGPSGFVRHRVLRELEHLPVQQAYEIWMVEVVVEAAARVVTDVLGAQGLHRHCRRDLGELVGQYQAEQLFLAAKILVQPFLVQARSLRDPVFLGVSYAGAVRGGVLTNTLAFYCLSVMSLTVYGQPWSTAIIVGGVIMAIGTFLIVTEPSKHIARLRK